MVDLERRKKLAHHLRHLSVGLISNDDFENNIADDVTNGWLPEQYHRSKTVKNDDPIIHPMLELCWELYDDTRRHKLVGSDGLTDESLKIVARWILFLQSDKEYEWPYFDTVNPLIKFSIDDYILTILTLGQHYRDKKKKQELLCAELKNLGDLDYWPFLRKADYEDQLTKTPFLNGQIKTSAQSVEGRLNS
jgi:hypothetical protein